MRFYSVIVRIAFIVYSFFLGMRDVKGQPSFSLSQSGLKTLVDSLSNQINRYYVDKEASRKMSAFLRKRCLEGKYNSIRDPHVLAGILTNDARSVCHDEHFHVEYNPALAKEAAGNIEDVPK